MKKLYMILKNRKVRMLDKRIINSFVSYVSMLSTILGLLLVFCTIPSNIKTLGFLVTIILFFILYLVIWYRANSINNVCLEIQGSTIHLMSGDIFEQEGLKVIPFNEYFDSIVDDRVINQASLNGQYIKKHYSNPADIRYLIDNNPELNSKKYIVAKDVERVGNNTKYKIGSCIMINDYILTAFAKFDEENKATMTMIDYLTFLNNFWNEINRLYGQKVVSVPVFGSGITRFRNGFEDISESELISIMIWTFKISKMKFAYPAFLKIIIHESKIDKINLYKLKDEEDRL